MSNDPLYKKGYIAGYWDGVKDAAAGTVTDWQSTDIAKLPIQAMGISTRACNCLVYSGYTHVQDLFSLSSCEIGRMRNVGKRPHQRSQNGSLITEFHALRGLSFCRRQVKRNIVWTM